MEANHDQGEPVTAASDEERSSRHVASSDETDSSSSSEDVESHSSLPPNKRRKYDKSQIKALIDINKVIPPAKKVRLNQLNSLQHFDTPAWKGLRYKTILQSYTAAPGFIALKVNEELSHLNKTKDFLVSADNFLAGLTNAQLEQQELHKEGIQNLVNWAASNPSDLNPNTLITKVSDFLGPDSPLHKCSERIIQLICGRRSETIEIRRDRLIKQIPSTNLKASLRAIPPSNEYLFSQEALHPVIQSHGGLQNWLNIPNYFKEKSNNTNCKQEKSHFNKNSKPAMKSNKNYNFRGKKRQSHYDSRNS